MWHRRADRTREHILIVMLALLRMEDFHKGIRDLDISTEAAIEG
jgi:hypothetical protein